MGFNLNTFYTELSALTDGLGTYLGTGTSTLALLASIEPNTGSPPFPYQLHWKPYPNGAQFTTPVDALPTVLLPFIEGDPSSANYGTQTPIMNGFYYFFSYFTGTAQDGSDTFTSIVKAQTTVTGTVINTIVGDVTEIYIHPIPDFMDSLEIVVLSSPISLTNGNSYTFTFIPGTYLPGAPTAGVMLSVVPYTS